MASMPPGLVLPTLLRTHLRHPIAALRTHFTLSLLPLVADVETAREMFFSSDMPGETLQRYHAGLQNESYSAFLDMLFLNLPSPARVTSPALVLGAQDDTVFLPDQIRDTVAAYGVDPILFPDMAHDMMLEVGWEEVAHEIVSWIETGACPLNPVLTT